VTHKVSYYFFSDFSLDFNSSRPGDDGSIGPMGGTRIPDVPHTCTTSSADYELALILKEIRFITDQVRLEEQMLQRMCNFKNGN